jgi:cardiolipin synthase (CMP-forming)
MTKDRNLSENNFNIPNIISSCRIASVPVMLFCIATGREHVFTWLLLAALVSDIVDGVIARLFHMETKLGATLDSMADMGTYLSAVIGLFVFKFGFIQAYWIQAMVILGFYVVEKISSFARYKKIFNAFHTYLSKITAYAQGAFVMSLFLFGFQWYLFYPAMALCIIANIEEMILARLLPDYESDVKGLYWVLNRKKKHP